MFGNTKFLTPAVLGAVLALGAMPAFAATGGEQAEMAGVTAARVAPTAAIQAAEAKVGGHAVDVGYEFNTKINAYEVTVATGAGLRQVIVDPATGAAGAVTNLPANALAGDGLPANAVRQAAGAPVSLANGVARAEQQGGGRALEANYVLKGGHVMIDVDVIGNGGTHSYLVDATNGQVSPGGRCRDQAGESRRRRRRAGQRLTLTRPASTGRPLP